MSPVGKREIIIPFFGTMPRRNALSKSFNDHAPRLFSTHIETFGAKNFANLVSETSPPESSSLSIPKGFKWQPEQSEALKTDLPFYRLEIKV